MITFVYIKSCEQNNLIPLTTDLPNSLRMLLIKLSKAVSLKMGYNKLLDYLGCEKASDFQSSFQHLVYKNYACVYSNGSNSTIYISFNKEEIDFQKQIIKLCNQTKIIINHEYSNI